MGIEPKAKKGRGYREGRSKRRGSRAKHNNSSDMDAWDEDEADYEYEQYGPPRQRNDFADSPDALITNSGADAALHIMPGAHENFLHPSLITGSSGVNMNNSLDLGVSPSAIFRAVPVAGLGNISSDPFSTAPGNSE